MVYLCSIDKTIYEDTKQNKPNSVLEWETSYRSFKACNLVQAWTCPVWTLPQCYLAAYFSDRSKNTRFIKKNMGLFSKIVTLTFETFSLKAKEPFLEITKSRLIHFSKSNYCTKKTPKSLWNCYKFVQFFLKEKIWFYDRFGTFSLEIMQSGPCWLGGSLRSV